jgi:hypothetical protein
MPAVQQQNRRKNGLDGRQFDEILQRFNAETAEEVDAAVCDALRFCDQMRMSFCDVVRNTYGHDERVAELDDRLGQARVAFARMEAERKKLADQLVEWRSKCSALSGENERLGQGARYCRGCERLRRILAVLAGFVLSASWLRLFSAHGLLYWVPALVLALIPFACCWCRWHWLLFRRKVRWTSWKDNDLVRWWKGLS